MGKTIKLNTNEGQNSFTTNKIKGFLDAVIVRVDELGGFEHAELIIESELGYLILHRNDLKGKGFLVIIGEVLFLDDRGIVGHVAP